MESGWVRSEPLPAPTRRQILAAMTPWLDDRAITHTEVLPGGLVNLNVAVHLEGAAPVVLRAYLRDAAACPKEHAILDRVRGIVPAPQVLYRGEIALAQGDDRRSAPFLLTTFVQGRRLAQVISSSSAPSTDRVSPGEDPLADTALRTAGQTIGAALARVHAIRFDTLGFLDANLDVPTPMPGVEAIWKNTCTTMLDGRAGARLGARASVVRRFVDSRSEALEPLEGHQTLLHADFKPTNILVDDAGRLTAFLDWEFAWAGPPLFDLGQMLRWPLPEVFERALIDAYEADAGPLPIGWRTQARLLDLLNLLGFLDRPDHEPVRERDVIGLIDRTLVEEAPDGGASARA